MTALTTHRGERLDLVCDQCGQRVPGISRAIGPWEQLWSEVRRHGWSGSGSAAGPHRCAHCSGRHGVGRATAPTRPAPWHATVHPIGVDAAVVALRGDLDVQVADYLRAVLDHACRGYTFVVLDLTDVHLIDSTCLGRLVRARQALRTKGGRMCLAAPSRFIVTVLHTMRLDRAFPAFDDRTQALEWVALGCPPLRQWE